MRFASGICLITEDVIRLAEFYQKVLQTKADLNDLHVTLQVEGGGITLYAKAAAETDMGFCFGTYHGTGLTKFTLIVDDVDAEHQRLASLGIPIEIPPTTYPWGARSMHFRDPDGHIVCFVNG